MSVPGGSVTGPSSGPPGEMVNNRLGGPGTHSASGYTFGQTGSTLQPQMGRAPISTGPPTRNFSGPPTGPPGTLSGPPTGPPGTLSGPPTGPSGTLSGPPGTLSGPPMGPSGTLSGPPTGPSGTLSGPPTGPFGTYSGPPTGPSGTLSGPPTGPSGTLSGPPTGPSGTLSGPPTGPPGNFSGPPTGPSGTLSGPPTGPFGTYSGPPTGPSGTLSGPPTGPSGTLSGPSTGPSGTLSGPPTGPPGNFSGPPTGTLSGPPMGSSGTFSGPPTGTFSGPPTGTLSGPPTGTLSGPPTGTLSGPPTGTFSGPPTGTLSGPPTGTLSGPPTGTFSGPPTGTFSGPPTGLPTGPPTGFGPPSNLSSSAPGTGSSSHISSHGTSSRYPVAPPTTGLASGPRLAAPIPGGPPGAGVGVGRPGTGPGAAGSLPAPPPSGQQQQSAADPYLRFISILENRNILPEQPQAPPPIVLPNGQGRYAPDHRVFCSTLNAVPATSSLLNKLKLPLAVHLHPFKDMSQRECPVLHPSIIVRCRSCRSYINPYVVFVDSRHWRCNMCFRPNTLPEDFDYNPATGRHGDRSHRTELKRSSVEYIAPSEYMVRPPQPSVYFFVVDVSFGSVESGVLSVFCRTLLEHLNRIPGDARTLVGLLTFDSSLHFYAFTSSLSQPQMLVVSDIEDVFLPSPESLLVNLKDFKEMFRSLLEDLPKMFAHNNSDRSALGAALQAASKLLYPVGGRITVIQCALPGIGPGALQYRDVAPASTKMPSLNTAPASDFYKSLALECNAQQISIDIFAFSGKFMDLSTLSCAAKFSSGQVFHYHDFHHSKKPARQRFQRDFERYLTRRIGFEAVMRLRCTEGVSLHTFHGNFFVRSTDLLSLPSVNPDLGYTMNISIDESLKDLGSVCFQAALLYTSSRGERRIRVHTLSLPVCDQLSHLYARANVLAIAGTLANMAVDRAVSSSLGDARQALMNTAVDSGKMFRTNVMSSRQSSQYVLPASLSLLPLYIVALLKSPAFTLSTKVMYDRRVQMMNLIKCTPVDYLICLLYPRLYAVHMITERDMVEKDDGCQELAPPRLHLSAEKLNRYGVYLMDYGMGLYLWVCRDASPEYLSNTLDVKHFGAIPEIMTDIPVLENETNILLRKFVKQIRSTRQHYLPLQVIREDGPHRLLFIERLVDDRTDLGTSYYEMISHIARQQSS